MKKQKVEHFLREYLVMAEDIDMEENCRIFIDEMEKGLRGEESSLKMLPTYISIEDEIPLQEPAIVLDAGGTNLRVATCYFDKNRKPVIEDYAFYPMPGTREEISREEFFDTLARYIEPVLHKSSKIGFCFSYPIEITPHRDGKLIQLTKEVKVKDLIGEYISKGLLRALKSLSLDYQKVLVILNDTVATLLGGKALTLDRSFESYIGFILGTGTNTSYVEQNRNITKAPNLARKEGFTIVNMESGGYGKAPSGVIDKVLDDSTADPGKYSFEKMISGRYQGGLTKAVVEKAMKEGLFSKVFVENFRKIKEITAKDINDFLYYPYSKSKLSFCCDEEDAIVLYYIIDAIMERAAKLVAINLSAVLLKTGQGKNPCRPVCIAADGSIFYKSKSFRSKLDYYVQDYVTREKGLYCEFLKTENAPLIGAAIAALTH